MVPPGDPGGHEPPDERDGKRREDQDDEPPAGERGLEEEEDREGSGERDGEDRGPGIHDVHGGSPISAWCSRGNSTAATALDVLEHAVGVTARDVGTDVDVVGHGLVTDHGRGSRRR